jgi:preprotein translocase subunit SecE
MQALTKKNRSVALIGRAPVSKTGWWGFESLQTCFKRIFCIMFDKIKKFLKEVRFELTKVTWTTRQELIYSTIVVIVVSIILSIFIGVVDLGLSNLASMLLS